MDCNKRHNERERDFQLPLVTALARRRFCEQVERAFKLNGGLGMGRPADTALTGSMPKLDGALG